VSDVTWLHFLTGGRLPTAVVVAVVIVLALGWLIKAATPLVAIILHKFRPEPGRRIQVERERGRLKIVIEPPEGPQQLPPSPTSANGTPRPKPKRPARRRKVSRTRRP
jgi:hypothetical protein